MSKLSPEAMACRAAENAMAYLGCGQCALACRIGCTDRTIKRILDGESVRLTTAQFVTLFVLGGMIRKE